MPATASGPPPGRVAVLTEFQLRGMLRQLRNVRGMTEELASVVEQMLSEAR